MKLRKSRVFLYALSLSLIAGTIVSTLPATTAYAKETANYEWLNESTIIIHSDFNVMYLNQEEKEAFKKVKKIEVNSNYVNIEQLQVFPNVETMFLSGKVEVVSCWRYDRDASSLKEVIVARDNAAYSSYDGILYDKDGSTLLYCPVNIDPEVELSPNLKIINSYAFYNVPIKSITIPEGLVKIKYDAFEKSGIKELSLPASFRTFDRDAFEDSAIETVNIAKENPSLVSIDGVVYNKAKTYLYYWPEQKKVEELTFPETMTFLDCGKIPNMAEAKTLNISKAMTAIYNTEKNQLEKIVLDPANQSFHLYDGVLYSLDEKYIRIYPNKNTDTDIVLSPKLESFPNKMFYTENTTTSLTLPASLKELRTDTTYYEERIQLRGFANLSELKFGGKNNNFTIVDGALYDKAITTLLWFPIDLKVKDVVLPSTLQKVANEQLAIQNNMETLNIPQKCNIYKMYQDECTSYYEMLVGKYCPLLKAFKVANKNPNYTVKDGVLFSKDMKQLYVYPSAKTTTKYTMPESVEIAAFGNSNKYLKTLVLSKNIYSIASSHWAECYDCPGVGLLNYTALEEIISDSNNTRYYTKDGVLYSAYKELLIYPVGKKDTEFYMSEDIERIFEAKYLSNNPYLKKLIIDANDENLIVNNGQLSYRDTLYNDYNFMSDHIEIITK